MKRRDVIVLAGSGIGILALSRSSSTSGSGSSSSSGAQPIGETSGLRYDRLRPVIGGVSIGVEGTDGIGTVAGGLEGPDGQPWVVTCRHVVDPGYPETDRDDVIGTDVYQPYPEEGGDPIGTVVDCGRSKGANSTDWAVIDISDAQQWTSEVIGLGQPSEPVEPSIGDRVVTSGIRTGLHSGVVRDLGVSANWSGTLVHDLIAYRIDDEGTTSTEGNSGAWVATIDSSGLFHPIGIHAFMVDGMRYAIPASQCVDGPGASIVSGGSLPSAPDGYGTYVEGALGPIESNATVQLVATGSDPITGREISILDESGNTIDSTTVDLDPLEHTTVSLSAPSSGPTMLDTGDETTQEWSE